MLRSGAVLAATVILAPIALEAQRPTLSDNVRKYVSTDASVIAIT